MYLSHSQTRTMQTRVTPTEGPPSIVVLLLIPSLQHYTAFFPVFWNMWLASILELAYILKIIIIIKPKNTTCFKWKMKFQMNNQCIWFLFTFENFSTILDTVVPKSEPFKYCFSFSLFIIILFQSKKYVHTCENMMKTSIKTPISAV